MPLHEYQCEACGHRFEKIQKFSDPPIETCPTCGGAVRKLMASPAIQFKGSGWYITDYAKKDSSGAGKTENTKDAAPAANDQSTASKSDSGATTPATSTEAPPAKAKN